LSQLEPALGTCVVNLVAEHLKAEKHVPLLLPWLERALALHKDLQARGVELIEIGRWPSLTRTLRGLSASTDASGIQAAKLYGLVSQQTPPVVPDPWVCS
jgi:hypothetical protein